MKKNIILITVLMVILSGCAASSPKPSGEQADANASESITAGDVAKNIALSPIYVVGGGILLVEKAIIGTLTVGVLAGKSVKNLATDDTNVSTEEPKN